LLTCPRSFLCNVYSKLSGNFYRGDRGRDIFDFTAAPTATAKTEKKTKSLVKKKNKVDYFLSKIYIYYILQRTHFNSGLTPTWLA